MHQGSQRYPKARGKSVGCTRKPWAFQFAFFLRPCFLEAFWVKWVLRIGALVGPGHCRLPGLWLNNLRIHWWKWIHIIWSLKMEVVGKHTGKPFQHEGAFLFLSSFCWEEKKRFSLKKCLAVRQRPPVTSPDLTEAVKPRSPKVIKLPPARPAPRPSARPVEPPSLEQRRLRWKTMGRKDGNIRTLVTLGWKFLRQTSDLQDMLTLFETSNRCWLFFWRQDLLLHWKVLRSGRISWKNLLLV